MIKKDIIIKIKFAAILKNGDSNSFLVKFILQIPKITEDRKYLGIFIFRPTNRAHVIWNTLYSKVALTFLQMKQLKTRQQ